LKSSSGSGIINAWEKKGGTWRKDEISVTGGKKEALTLTAEKKRYPNPKPKKVPRRLPQKASIFRAKEDQSI